jgi:uncharacterized protein with GYD domain
MPIYVNLVKFTQHGLTTMKDEGVARAVAAKRNIESLGGKLLHVFYCSGPYDAVAIVELPDDRTAMKAAVMNASPGHVEIMTMPAIPREERQELLKEVEGK